MKKLISLIITALFALCAEAQNINLSFTADPVLLEITPSDDPYGNYTEFTIGINLMNSVPVMAAQFDIDLPEGIEVIKGTRSSRCTSGMTVSINDYGNATRVVISSLSKPRISGNEGRICTLTLRASNDVEEYAKDFLLSEDFKIKFFEASCSCKLISGSYYGISIPAGNFFCDVQLNASAIDRFPYGDFNHDTKVTIDDLDYAAASLAAGQLADRGLETDVNWDGQFSIADITALIKKLNK